MIHINAVGKSLNKFGEELCGDKVEIARVHDSTIAVLADGLGSGVKANILATLTSKIITTMLVGGASVEQAVDTIVNTLPVCNERQIAYCTFSVLQIWDNGQGYLVEFDNPFCVFIRNEQILQLPCEHKVYSGKEVYETHFIVMPGDILTLMSDGIIYAGVGETLNFGWDWDSVAGFILKSTKKKECSAPRLAAGLIEAVNDLYMNKPGDDSTVLVIHVMSSCVVNLLSGPPIDQKKDGEMVRDFMEMPGLKVVCGGTSANIVARELKCEISASLTGADPRIPPTARIKGIDLVTEGVLTLRRSLEMLKHLETMKKRAAFDGDMTFFHKLDEENGASMLSKLLLERCTKLRLFVGMASNPAHHSPDFPVELSLKIKLIESLRDVVARMGKKVETYYY
jgi:hypothetical protein